jgi:alpha-galactosidase
MALCCALLFLSLLPSSVSLNNGQGLLPEMGFNSWYAFHSHLVNYQWVNFTAGDELVKVADWFTAQGLQTLGFTYMNMDDCIVVGRDPVTHELIPDPLAFPRGPAVVGAALAARGYRFGWYTCRGNTTCATSRSPPLPPRPGSAGFEALDALTYKRWGIS